MNIAEALKIREGSDSHSACAGIEKGLQSDSLIRLIIRGTGKSVQFQITAAEGGKVYVVGTLNKMDQTVRPLSAYPDIFVFRATLFVPFGTK